MNYSTNRGFPAGNPIANALVVIVGALAIAGSLVLGIVAFLALAALVTVFTAIIGIRVWWFNRRRRRTGVQGRKSGGGQAPHQVIEGEFRVIEAQRARERHD